MKTRKRIIEIEFRARFGKDKFDSLGRFLKKHARDLGKDDKDVYFFIFPDKLLKVVNNVSRKSAKLVLKLNKIGRGSDFEEIEVPVAQSEFEKIANIFKKILICDPMHAFQKRHNYLYKGVELALKWSEIWGYHLELEVVIDTLSQKNKAEKNIFLVAEELGVRIITDQELKEFTEKAEKDYKTKR